MRSFPTKAERKRFKGLELAATRILRDNARQRARSKRSVPGGPDEYPTIADGIVKSEEKQIFDSWIKGAGGYDR